MGMFRRVARRTARRTTRRVSRRRFLVGAGLLTTAAVGGYMATRARRNSTQAPSTQPEQYPNNAPPQGSDTPTE